VRFQLIILSRSCATIPRTAQHTHSPPPHGESRSKCFTNHPTTLPTEPITYGYYSATLIKKKKNIRKPCHCSVCSFSSIRKARVLNDHYYIPFHSTCLRLFSIVWSFLRVTYESHQRRHQLGVRTGHFRRHAAMAMAV
jgi:hypothetical protein